MLTLLHGLVCAFSLNKSLLAVSPHVAFTCRKKKLAEVEKHERLAPHPNCVQFYRAWEERHRLYIQIELCLMSLSECADLHGRLGNAVATKFLVDLIKVDTGVTTLIHSHVHTCTYMYNRSNCELAVYKMVAECQSTHSEL